MPCTQALKTTYTMTPRYLEIGIDISANSLAAYATGLMRGATKSLVIDLGGCTGGVNDVGLDSC